MLGQEGRTSWWPSCPSPILALFLPCSGPVRCRQLLPSVSSYALAPHALQGWAVSRTRQHLFSLQPQSTPCAGGPARVPGQPFTRVIQRGSNTRPSVLVLEPWLCSAAVTLIWLKRSGIGSVIRARALGEPALPSKACLSQAVALQAPAWPSLAPCPHPTGPDHTSQGSSVSKICPQAGGCLVSPCGHLHFSLYKLPETEE